MSLPTPVELQYIINNLDYQEINSLIAAKFEEQNIKRFDLPSLSALFTSAINHYLPADFLNYEVIGVEAPAEIPFLDTSVKLTADLILYNPTTEIKKVIDWKCVNKGEDDIDELHVKEFNSQQWPIYALSSGAQEVEFRFISHKSGVMEPLLIDITQARARMEDTLDAINNTGEFMRYCRALQVPGKAWIKFTNNCLGYDTCGFFKVCRERWAAKGIEKDLIKIMDAAIVEGERDYISYSNMRKFTNCPEQFRLYKITQSVLKDGILKLTDKERVNLEHMIESQSLEAKIGTVFHYGISLYYKQIAERL